MASCTSQLVPTTNADTPAVYTVQYNSNGSTVYTEAWAIPPSSTSLRVRDVRLAPGTVTGSAPAPSSPPSTTPPGQSTSMQITDVNWVTRNALSGAANGRSIVRGLARAAVIDSTGALDRATGNLSDCLHVDGTTGPCGSGSGGSTGSGSFVDAEFPAGTIDGTNAAFTLSNAPAPPASLEMFRNGMLLKQGNDYTLSGSALTFLAGAVPNPGDTLVATYRLAVAITGVGFVSQKCPRAAQMATTHRCSCRRCRNPAGSLEVFRWTAAYFRLGLHRQ